MLPVNYIVSQYCFPSVAFIGYRFERVAAQIKFFNQAIWLVVRI